MTRLRQRWIQLALIGAPVVLALAIGVLISNRFAGPLPPRRLVISTGPVDGAYYRYALEYRRALAQQGFTLEIRPGPGSMATLQKLMAGEVDVGFVQGGTVPEGVTGLTALGSLFYEPLWIFHRKGLGVTSLSELHGRRLAVGEEGSGTRALVLRLLTDNGVTEDGTFILPLGNVEAEHALTGGQVDVAFFVLAPRAGLVQRLLSNPQIELMMERRLPAYAGRYQFMESLRISEGALDMARNIPREDRTVFGVTAALVVSASIHPDLVRLLLDAADRVHRKGGLLERAGQFPSEANLELPLNEQARRYLRNGPSWLERTFPFWLAGLLDRTVLVILPAVTLLFPLLGWLRPTVENMYRRRIARRYLVLRESEERGETLSAEELKSEIDRLLVLRRQVIDETEVPLKYSGEIFHLTMHIDLLLERFERRRRELLESPVGRA